MSVELDERGLHSRRRVVQSMLRPLRSERLVACDFDVSAWRFGRVLGAHDGANARMGNYRTWWFRTSCRILRAQYFEVWRDLGEGLQFKLLQAYLHLSRIDTFTRTEYEIIALHADPNDEYRHKRGPHIHVLRSEEPLPHCHFPMNSENVSKVLDSCDTFTKAMKSGISVLAVEVIERYSALR